MVWGEGARSRERGRGRERDSHSDSDKEREVEGENARNINKNMQHLFKAPVDKHGSQENVQCMSQNNQSLLA